MANEPDNLYLVGYRCTGKSSVGRWVADRLKWRFADSDALVESLAGRTIAEIVAREGWQGFRSQERAAMIRLCLRSETVVATGGGVVLNNENVGDMQRTGWIVWLRAAPETIAERMRADAQTDSQRPSLTGAPVLSEIAALIDQRQPLYQAAAQFAVETDRLSLSDVAQSVVDWFTGKLSNQMDGPQP